MMKDLKYTVNLEDVDADLAKEWRDANQKARDAADKLIDAYRKSERFSMAHDLSGMKGASTKVNMSVGEGKIDVTLRIQLVDDPVDQMLRRLDHSTVNLLLNSKLLTDEQKRNLLKQIGIDVSTLDEGMRRRQERLHQQAERHLEDEVDTKKPEVDLPY